MLLLLLVVSIKVSAINKEALVQAFIYVESKGNRWAVNKKTQAVGVLQLKPVVIDECNRLIGRKKYRLADRTNIRKSKEMFHIIMKHKNPSYNIAKACKIWNYKGGIEYRRKVEKKYRELTRKRRR